MVEHVNYSIMDMASNILHAQNLHKLFWAEVVANAIYNQNQYPTRALDTISFKKTWSRRKPCIANMLVFGCIAFAIKLDENNDMFNANGIKYLKMIKAYTLMYY